MTNELFERTSIPRAVIFLGLPTMAGMALTVLYNMADMIFVGMAGDEQQLAVVTLLTPVSVVAMSIGAVFGIGGASCISRQLGTRRRRDAARTSAFCFYSSLLLSILGTAAGLAFLPLILRGLGAAGTIAPLAERYGRLILLGTVPASLCFTMNQLLRSRGAAKEAMNGMALGAVINLAADPLLIITLGMGAEGSAAASLLADLLSLFYYIHLMRRDDILSMSPRDFSLTRSSAGSVLAVGIPTCLTHFLLCFSGILFNRMAMSYGDHTVAAFGVASRVMMMPAMISMGLAKGAQPLIGYNYASGNLQRMRSAIRFSCIVGTAFCLVFSVFVYFRSGGLIQVFTDDPDVVWLGMVILNAMLFAMPVSALEAVLITTFQAMGKAGAIFFLSVGKQLLLYIPLMLLANHFMGLYGLILLDPVKEYLSTFLALLFYLVIMRRK